LSFTHVSTPGSGLLDAALLHRHGVAQLALVGGAGLALVAQLLVQALGL
jgi:hypothetical protein